MIMVVARRCEENGRERRTGVNKGEGGREASTCQFLETARPLAEFLADMWRRRCPIRKSRRVRVVIVALPSPASLALPVTDDNIIE